MRTVDTSVTTASDRSKQREAPTAHSQGDRMTASKFFAQVQQREQASTTATRKPTAKDIRLATGSTAVDFHVDQASTKE